MAEYSGHRVQLQKEINSVYTTVAQIRDISGPAIEADQIEVSHRDSTNFFRLWQAGMRDGGEVTFDIVFDPDHASHDPTISNSLYDDIESGTQSNFKIIFPGAGAATTTATFAAFVSGFEIEAPMEDALTASITLKINGAITWAHVP